MDTLIEIIYSRFLKEIYPDHKDNLKKEILVVVLSIISTGIAIASILATNTELASNEMVLGGATSILTAMIAYLGEIVLKKTYPKSEDRTVPVLFRLSHMEKILSEYEIHASNKEEMDNIIREAKAYSKVKFNGNSYKQPDSLSWFCTLIASVIMGLFTSRIIPSTEESFSLKIISLIIIVLLSITMCIFLGMYFYRKWQRNKLDKYNSFLVTLYDIRTFGDCIEKYFLSNDKNTEKNAKQKSNNNRIKNNKEKGK